MFHSVWSEFIKKEDNGCADQTVRQKREIGQFMFVYLYYLFLLYDYDFQTVANRNEMKLKN